MMRAGRLRHLATIEYVSSTSVSAIGERTDTWSTYATRRVEIVPESGREYERLRQVQQTMTHLLRMRYCEGLTADMRISVRSRTFQILSVMNIFERDREMVVACVEQV